MNINRIKKQGFQWCLNITSIAMLALTLGCQPILTKMDLLNVYSSKKTATSEVPTTIPSQSVIPVLAPTETVNLPNTSPTPLASSPVVQVVVINQNKIDTTNLIGVPTAQPSTATIPVPTQTPGTSVSPSATSQSLVPSPTTSTGTDASLYWTSYSFPKNIRSMSSINMQTVWVAGENGMIRHTENGGKTWVVQDKGTMNYNSISFVNKDVGWLAGDKMLYKTTDAGNSWIPIDLDLITDKSQYQGFNISTSSEMSFHDEQNGVITGWGSGWMSTSDGGKSWKYFKFSYPDIGSYKLILTSPNSGISCTNYDCFFYKDDNFIKSDSSGIGSFLSLTMPTPEKGWLTSNTNFGNVGLLHKTIDSGRSWIKVQKILIDDEFAVPQRDWSISCANEMSCLIIGTPPGSNTFKLFATKDGGATWKTLKVTGFTSVSAMQTSFQFYNESFNGWGYNYGHLYKLST